MKKCHTKFQFFVIRHQQNIECQKTFITYKIYEWLNCALNDLSSQNNIFFVCANWNAEQKKIKITCQICEIKKQFYTQIHIEKIGLIKFLYKYKIFDFFYSNCSCDVNEQMLKHVVIQFFLMSNINEIWNMMNVKNYQHLMSIFKTTKILTRWFINSDLLTQFALIKIQFN